MHPADRVVRLLLLLGLSTVGCAHSSIAIPSSSIAPTESFPATIDTYIANPPDVLFIEMEPQPSPEQKIQDGESLLLSVPNALPDYPLQGVYAVEAGEVDLGIYGKVQVLGKSLAEAKEIIRQQVAREIVDPTVQLQLAQMPPIAGQYLIRPDGKIKLGFYGDIFVTGKTLDQIEFEVREFLRQEHGIADLKLAIDVATFNSMVYYIVTDGGGSGDQVTKLPYTGQETVLDAFAEIGGIPQFGSKSNIWISRPIPDDPNSAEILPVDWNAITKQGLTASNYQILPGDRIYVKADKLIAADTWLGKIIAPIERISGFITLFDITIDSLGGNQGGIGNNNNSNF